MDQLDREVIESLSEPAKRVFGSLDYRSKQRMLKKARAMAKEEKTRNQKKSRVKKKGIEKQNKAKRKKKRSSSKSERVLFSIYETKDLMVQSMHLMLLGSSVADNAYEERDFAHTDEPQVALSRETVQKSSRVAMGGMRTLVQRNRHKKAQRKAAGKSTQKSAQAVQTGAKAGTQAAKTLAKTMQRIVRSVAANPVVWIVLLVIILLAVIVGAIGTIVGSGGAANESQDGTYQAQVSEKTESYREMVSEYCGKYGIDDYVDLCLAMIEQESGGIPPDVMQTAQSYYNVNPPIDSAEESIDCGTHELSDCLTKAKCKDPNDINGISLALQGYNFGNGYIDWALKNYGCYTKENAQIFSVKMCAELGYASYGDVEYVPHVLRYYVMNEETRISNESAKTILEELKKNNTAPAEAWDVIEKGASLIGSVKYSMEKRQADGRDKPEFLDCSSFSAWAFHKAGVTSVPYGSTTATFIGSKKFHDISAERLQPGDIGLKSRTGETGGANHVGIYCGKLKDGRVVWLHCTSSSGSSLTGNIEGAMFGVYTNFTYFRRLKKWDKK